MICFPSWYQLFHVLSTFPLDISLFILGNFQSCFNVMLNQITFRYDGLHHGSSYLEHLHFLSAIRDKQGPAVDLHDGLVSVAMGVAAQFSIEKGRFVTIEEVM